jgi:multidrug transporter EmrE-like cation transporter
MAWIAVITAGILEVGFATMLKLSYGLQSYGQVWAS